MKYWHYLATIWHRKLPPILYENLSSGKVPFPTPILQRDVYYQEQPTESRIESNYPYFNIELFSYISLQDNNKNKNYIL